MRSRGWRAAALSIVLALTSGSSDADQPAKPSTSPKKILVESYSTRGCDSCPSASDLVGRLAKLGYGPDRVVVLNFHVDPSDRPWGDPYSGPVAARRQAYYGEVLGRRDPSSLPLMVVDGRDPVVGLDRSARRAALAKADRESAVVTLDLAITGPGARKSLSVRVAGRSRLVDGRELVVGVALAEGPVTTKVRAGEDAGRSPVAHQVVRRFAQKSTRLDGARPQTLTFPVELGEAGEAGRSRVAAFVQDRLDGAVYQAESIPWPPAEQARGARSEPKGRRPKARRSKGLSTLDLSPSIAAIWPDDSPSCPDCGTPLSTEYLNTLPPGLTSANRHHFPNLPLPGC